jgi:hypothetical protein
MEVHIRELQKLLPYAVRDKFRYYLDYVNDRLIDIALEEGIYHRLPDVRPEVEVVFFLRLLYGYFVIGFHNYEKMLSYLDSKEIDGFQIGSTVFTKQSPITRHWSEVAHELERLVKQTSTASLVRPSMSIEAVIRQIVRALPGQTESRESDE